MQLSRIDSPEANNLLGIIYSKEQPEKAKLYFNKAILAPWSYFEAMYNLALLYDVNKALADNDTVKYELLYKAAEGKFEAAETLLKDAANGGDENAQYALYQLNGELSYLEKAAEELPQAMLKLALLEHDKEKPKTIELIQRFNLLLSKQAISKQALRESLGYVPNLVLLSIYLSQQEAYRANQYDNEASKLIDGILTQLTQNSQITDEEVYAIYSKAAMKAGRNDQKLVKIIKKYVK